MSNNIEKIYNCVQENCNYITKYKHHLNSHLRNKHNIGNFELYKCELEKCNFITKEKGNLTTHLRIIHNIGKFELYKCGLEKCIYTTKVKSHLNSHLKNIHNIGNIKTYSCDQKNCIYTTKLKGNLNNHLSIKHDIGDFQCEYCNRNVAKISPYTCPKNNITSNICRSCYKKETGFSTHKEEQMVTFLKEDLILKEHISLTNSIIKGDSCNTKRRPDLLITSQDLNIIIECDENQHKNYELFCENGHLDEIIDELKTGKIVIIRWNPDTFKVENKTISIPRQKKLFILKEKILDIINKSNNIEDHIHIYYMFYSDNSKLFSERWNITKIFT